MGALWEEKNLIDQNQNYSHKKELEIRDITINTSNDLIQNQCENIIKVKCSICQVEKPQTSEFFQPAYVKGYEHLFRKQCRNCKYLLWVEKLYKIKKDPILLANRRKKKADYYQKCGKTEKIRERKRNWLNKNRDQYNKRCREIYHEKRKYDPKNKIKLSFSGRIRKLIKDKNYEHVFDILGYSVKELMIHLEKQFRDGMTWENYGPYWHIDHIKPVSKFNFSSKNDLEFKQCWALSNLQPLLAKENLMKYNKYP